MMHYKMQPYTENAIACRRSQCDPKCPVNYPQNHSFAKQPFLGQFSLLGQSDKNMVICVLKLD